MSATNRTNAYAYGESSSTLMLIFLILGILILLDGILGLFSNESLPPMFKVILGSMCIFSVFLLVLTRHIETQAHDKTKNDRARVPWAYSVRAVFPLINP